MKRTNKSNFIIIILLLISILLAGVVFNKINNAKKDLEQSYTKEEIKNIPTTNESIKNVIFMIGDGMGENHIIAGGIHKGEELNIQKIKNKLYVTTASTEPVTDSAAAATALSTGFKTNNGMLGKDKVGNDLENLIEYSHKKGLKTGLVCTQILNHATPAGFSIHNDYRYNYEQIAQSQIESCVDLMFGGGRKYFSKYETKIEENKFTWINSLSEVDKINKNIKIIGTFADESISEEKNRTALADMTRTALSRLENDTGFFLMIEGSDIDSYSHKENISKMLVEMIDFDEAVKVAKEYVDEHPDTLLIVTADHETGGLDLTGVTSANQLTDSLYTSNGEHTNANVLLYAYGKGAEDLTQYDVIDNTDICKFIRKGIENNQEK